MKELVTGIRSAIVATLVFAAVCCGAYPLVVWGIAQALFPGPANGSLVRDASGTIRGSRLLAQPFSSEKYFQPRPSSAGATGYDGTASGGTNLGPTSARLAQGSHAKDAAGKEIDATGNFDGIADLVAVYRRANGLRDDEPVPADAVTRSGSGLDPHISPRNAELQAPRVARARNLPLETVRDLIRAHTEGPGLGFLGDPGVNVLGLNLALDALR